MGQLRKFGQFGRIDVQLLFMEMYCPASICTTHKAPLPGLFVDQRKSVGTGADHFDFNATVLGATFLGLVVSHGLLFALPSVYTVLFRYPLDTR